MRIFVDNANNNNEFLTPSVGDNASRNIPLCSGATCELIDNQANQEAAGTASASSTACSCSITTPQGSASDDFTQSDDRSHGSIIQKIKSITQVLTGTSTHLHSLTSETLPV